jgi:hypothetical protein
VSCAPTGDCAAVGDYMDSSGQAQAFVADETPAAASTSVSMSVPAETYGDEQAKRLSVTVTSPDGTPGGTVTVHSGTVTVCTITLASGSGTCTLPATEFPAGTAQLTASYGGNTDFDPSTSAAVPLTVSPAATTTSLSLSAVKVTYGKEQAEHLTVTVTPHYSGTPGGTVTIKTGTATVCTITLAAGKGSCTLTARKLRPGTYALVAAYPGGRDFTSSASAKKTLTVVK